MKDRIPKHPGRVKLTPVAGEAQLFDMELADEPLEVGTALSKGTLLDDVSCDLLGIPHTAVPTEAFQKLSLGTGKYGYKITVLWPDGQPMVGFVVTGITAIDGKVLVTDVQGEAFGVSTKINTRIGVQTTYADLQCYADVVSTKTITEATLTAWVVSQSSLDVSTTTTLKFSRFTHSLDLYLVGGGAAGTPGNTRYDVSEGGNGGRGGEIVNKFGHTIRENDVLSVEIGAGGESGVQSVGSTHVKINGITVAVAQGGNGASGGAGSSNRGTGTPAGAGKGNSVPLFDTVSMLHGGGGGGGGASGIAGEGAGGYPVGGTGGTKNSAGLAARGNGGGGGGGGAPSQNGGYAGGRGGNGVVRVRWGDI